MTQPFTVGGYAFEPGNTTDTGVAAVDVWAYPKPGDGNGIPLGQATVGLERWDVAFINGLQFRFAGFAMTVTTLAPGAYTIGAVARPTGAVMDLVDVVVVAPTPTLAGLARQADQVPRWNGSSWECADRVTGVGPPGPTGPAGPPGPPGTPADSATIDDLVARVTALEQQIAPPPRRTIDLADVSTSSGLLRVSGSTGSGSAGVPVAAGADGDGDGDGFEDYAMAAMQASPFGRNLTGEVYLVFGDGVVAGSLDTATPHPAINPRRPRAPRSGWTT